MCGQGNGFIDQADAQDLQEKGAFILGYGHARVVKDGLLAHVLEHLMDLGSILKERCAKCLE